jgi:transcriptional regulator with XRE-family HTH domain
MMRKARNTKRALPVDVHVGSRVRMRRMMLKMSQSELGDALKLTFQQIQKYEKGSNRIGSSRLQQIADKLKVPVAFFFQGLAQSSVPAEAAEISLINEFLSTREGVQLAQCIVRMPPAIRRRFVELADTLAGDSAQIPQAASA